MVTALFKEGQKAVTTTSLHKYDYGEVLRIKGLSLPQYVAVQFAVDGMSEALPSSIGETVEGVTDVLIPNSLLRSNINPWNYNIMAYVYIVSGSSGKTEYIITIPIKWRPKTGDDQAADDDVAAVIGSAVEKMNTATQRAETAASDAETTAAEIAADREQIQTNTADISSLKGDLDRFIHIVKSVNLWNPAEEELGRIQNDGTVDATATGYVSSGFIYVHDYVGKYVCPQGSNNNIIYNSLKFYDANKNPIPQAQGGGGLGTNTSAIQIIDTAYYVRVSQGSSGTHFIGINDDGTAFAKIDTYKYYQTLNKYWYWEKKIVIYGDSITATGDKWLKYVADYFNAKYVNCGIGGSTVANANADLSYDSNPNKPMVTDERIATIPEDADVIIFFGGVNDWGAKIDIGSITDGETTFKGAYMLTLKKLMLRCTNAVIICMTPINGRLKNAGVIQDYPTVLSNGKSLIEYRNAILEVSAQYGIPCIDLFAECGINTINATKYLKDVIHQNDTYGSYALANACINGLKRFEPIEFV